MDKPQTCSHSTIGNPSNQTCHMTNKQSTMPEGWFTNFVHKRQRDNKPEICTPVYNFSRLLTDASNSEIVRQKGHCLSSWSVYKCVSSLFRIQIVACEGTGVPTGFKGSLSTDRLKKLDKFKNSQEFETEIQEFIASENGIDRLQRMFQYDEVTNEYSAQLQLQVKLTAQTMTMFFIFGFLTKMPQEEKEFKKRNQLTMYATKRMASKRMYESIMLRRLKGGIMAVLFTCRSVLPILYIEQLLTVYFNKTNPLFMTFSAGLVCSAMPFMRGPRAMAAGGVLGAGMGFVGGMFMWMARTLTGERQESHNYRTVKEHMKHERGFRKKTPLDENEEDDIPD